MEIKNGDTVIRLSRMFHDLTQIISKDIPVYSGDPQPDFEQSSTIDKDSYNVTRISMGSHTGTHVDAPRHFMIDGNSIDREPLSKFIGESIVIDLSKRCNIGEGITCSDLEAYSKIIRENDILLLYTGTSDTGLRLKY